MTKEHIHQIGTVARVFAARLRFVGVFVIAALLVGYWDDIRNHIDKWTRPAAAAAENPLTYTCSMHPYVIAHSPGLCPVCGMELVEKKAATTRPADVLARVQFTPRRIEMANIRTSPVEFRQLVREIHTVGVLDYDETKVAQLSARVAGRADQLFITSVGQAIKQGDPVYSLYSPDVYTAQREYLLARKRVNELEAAGTPDAKADASAVYNASMQKLVLWGVTTQQLDHMDKEYDQTGTIPTHLTVASPISGTVIRKDLFEGGYVQAGDTPFTIADLGTLWLKAKVYEQDLPLVQIGQPVDVKVDALPNERFHGTIAFVAFQVDPQTRTTDARIVVKNDDQRLRPGMFADATIQRPVTAASQPLALSTSAPAPAGLADSKAYQAALQPYLESARLLAQDKSDTVTRLLEDSLAKLQPISEHPDVKAAYGRLADAVARTKGQDIKAMRKTFREVSVAMIEIGKAVKLPPDAPAVQIFRCPMTDKPYWMQTSPETANPYYGTEMPTCGSAVEPLPKLDPAAAPASQPAAPAGNVLAVPRSAVVDTGEHKFVYAQAHAPDGTQMEGVFDMREVTLGPLAGEWYPLVAGLREGENVVTVGTFLVDSENRLNP